MNNAENILVIRLGALGDVINTFWAVRALRRGFPGARITWLVEEGAAPLVGADPDVDETLVLPRRRWSRRLRAPLAWPGLGIETRGFMRALRARRFDVLFDFQGNLKSGLLAWRSGTPRRIGFAAGFNREWNRLFMTERVRPDMPRQARAEKFLALVRHVLPDAAPERPGLRISDGDEHRVDAVLAGLAGDGPMVGIHPGTSEFGAFKRWPPERYGAVAAGLRERLGARTLVTWGPADAPLPEAVVAASGGAASLAPLLTLGQLAALLRRLDLVIASDTGPLHLAALLGRPVVAIFGPKDPVVYGPYGCPAKVIRRDLPCSPCTRRRCPRARCIEEITPEEVCAAAVELLRGTATGR